MRRAILEALKARYEAEIAEADATANISLPCIEAPSLSVVAVELKVTAPPTTSAAIAAADPPEEPPGANGSLSLDKGFIVFPKKLVLVAEPIANSSRFVFPTKIEPSSNNFWVTYDS